MKKKKEKKRKKTPSSNVKVALRERDQIEEYLSVSDVFAQRKRELYIGTLVFHDSWNRGLVTKTF